MLNNFATKLLSAHWDVSITRDRLLELVHDESCASLQPDALLTYLVKVGLLLNRDADAFWLAVPDSGPLVRDISFGRKELLQILKRRKFKEIPLKVRSCACSQFGNYDCNCARKCRSWWPRS